MPSELLKTIFNQEKIAFKSIDLASSSGVSSLNIARHAQIACEILFYECELYIALYLTTHKFDLSRLNKVVGKQLSRVDDKEAEELNACLVKGMALNLKSKLHVFIDEELQNQDELFFIDDNGKHACIVDVNEVQKLSNEDLIGVSFAERIVVNMEIKETVSFKERVKALHSLPPMPHTATQILNLRALPEVKSEQLLNLVEKDPALVAQIVSYANSSFFGQAGSVVTIKDAIFRVLGVDAVMNMALAISVGSTFRIPQTGPLGSNAIWKSSIYTASLMQRFSMLMPWGERPNPGTAYLVGLLHDVGLLVIGHLFHDEYVELNKFLNENKDVNLFAAEKKILGITHIEVGKMLMRLWNMPEELVEVASHFTDKDYSGEYKKYIQLLTIIKRILVPHGLAFGDTKDELPLALLEELSMDEEAVIIAADEVLQEGDIFKELIKQMSA